MDIEKILKQGRIEVEPEEREIRSVVQKAKTTFLKRESTQILPFHEFLWNQFLMIKKKWWAIQFAVLCMGWLLLSNEQEPFYVRRSMGVLASLFSILLIPELWRNLSNRCVEIEMASYYSLHQIYAARIILFGIMDVLFLTIFMGGAHYALGISIASLITQFLLPMVVTACICLFILGKYFRNRWIATGLCALWGGAWWAISAIDQLYSAILLPMWLAVFAFSCLFLAFTIYRLLKSCDNYTEVNTIGTVFE